jgi:hypothetical protein
MKSELEQCVGCGHHLHKEHEIIEPKTGQIYCTGCSWVWVNDEQGKGDE